MTVPRIAVVGGHGHGRSHLLTTLDAHRAGSARLVGVIDLVPVEPHILADAPGVLFSQRLDEVLEQCDPDVVIVSTPIHTHAELALAAVRAGADVLLEKPPTATMAEFDELTAAADKEGRLVQVGFQSLASTAVPFIRDRIARGVIGEVVRFGASAGWVRPDSYWTRAPWAGKRRLGERVVADGVLTNPLAHATATALAIADRSRSHEVVDVTLDLHRANDIESDDTSVARLSLRQAPSLTTAVTLCASGREEPYVEAIGTRGGIRFYYAIDVVQEWRDDDPPFTTRHSRVGLLDDLLASRRDGTPLAAPLSETGGFVRMLQGVMDAPEPHRISDAFVTTVTDGAGTHRVVRDVERALHVAVRAQQTFRELGLRWARS